MITESKDPEKILVIRLSALGDNVLAIPAVRLLARRFPGAAIHWLTEQPYVSLLRGVEGVEPIPYDKKGADKGLAGLIRLRRRLGQEGYDLVVDLQNKPKTGILRGAGKRSIAYRKRSFMGALKSLAGREPPLDREHTTEALAKALAPLGIGLPEGEGERQDVLTPRLKATEAMRREASSAGISPSTRTVGIAPGARWATKRWAAERFALLARRFEDEGRRILLVGGPGDRAAFDVIRGQLAHPELCLDTASLSVGGLAGALACCDLCVTGDSGPAHIAGALGVPTLAIFGPTSVRRWAPRGPFTQVATLNLPCSPCSNFGGDACPLGTHDCMAKLEVEQVHRQAMELMAKAESKAGEV